MRRPSGRQRRQHGAALILFLTILVLGVAWFAVGALGKAPVATAEREVITGRALQAAKQALLAYVAQHAARSTTADPGQMPCPESLTLANPGEASTSCSATALVVGRLPWKTLGIDPLRDGAGEPLWYMMRGFRDPPINFGTAGQLTYNGNTVVAMIIAPGVPLSTTGTPPAGCTAQNQLVATRNAATLNPANFLECGVATGSIASPGDSTWTNDRVIAITAAEWADAIAPAIADRLQRQVAPALADWHTTQFAATGKSWAATHGISYLPFASTWGDPVTNTYCGSDGVHEGLPPISLTCANNPWTGIPSSLINIGLASCTDMGTYLRCTFTIIDALLGASVQITATAADVAQSYRSTIRGSDIAVSSGGTATISGMTISASSSNAVATIDASWPALSLGPFQVDIPHLQQAAVLTDSRLTWFRSNDWHQYTYYSIAPGAAAPATSACAPATSCLTVSGLAASTGNANDKRLALVIAGRALASQTRPSASLTDYLEVENASTADRVFAAGTTSTTFNDRLGACPFKYQDHAGADVVICN